MLIDRPIGRPPPSREAPRPSRSGPSLVPVPEFFPSSTKLFSAAFGSSWPAAVKIALGSPSTAHALKLGDYHIDIIPTLVVAGKYKIGPVNNGPDGMATVLDYLVKRVQDKKL